MESMPVPKPDVGQVTQRVAEEHKMRVSIIHMQLANSI
jgi:hypothetical protein